MTNLAIYNYREFKNSKESIAFVKQKIKEDLEKNSKEIDTSKDTVSFVVLSNGKIENIRFTGNDKAKTVIQETLKNLDKEWFPALIKASKVTMELRPEQKDLKIKAHSKVIIPLN